MPPRPVRPAQGSASKKAESASKKAESTSKDRGKSILKKTKSAKADPKKADPKAEAKAKESPKKGAGTGAAAAMSILQTVKRTAKRVDPQALADARFELSVATRDLLNTRAMLVPLRKELKRFRPKAKTVIDDHRILEEDVEEHKREMTEMRERHQLAVVENAEHKEQIREGEDEVESIHKVVKDAYQEISDMEDQRGKLMASILSERKRIEIFIGVSDTFEHEFREIEQDHAMMRQHVKDNIEACAELHRAIERERKQEMEVHIDLCDAMKRKHSLIKKIPKWERVRIALKEELVRREHEVFMKERIVASVSKENRELKRMLASAEDRNKLLEERVLQAEAVNVELDARVNEVARVALMKRTSLAVLGAAGSEDPIAIAAHEYMKTGNEHVFDGATIKHDRFGRSSVVLDPHHHHGHHQDHHHGHHQDHHHAHHQDPHHGHHPHGHHPHGHHPHGHHQDPHHAHHPHGHHPHGHHPHGHHQDPHHAHHPHGHHQDAHHGHHPHGHHQAKTAHSPQQKAPLEIHKTQLSPVAEEDTSTDDSSSASHESDEPGLVGGSSRDQDGLPFFWAGITEWDEEDELLMQELIDSGAQDDKENREHQGRAGSVKQQRKESRRRRSKWQQAGKVESRRKNPKGRRETVSAKSKESREIVEDGSDGGSTKYASSSEVAGISVNSLTDDTGSSWPEML